MNARLFVVVILITTAFEAQAVAKNKKLAPLPVDTIARTQMLAPVPVSLSPDGEWLAYTTMDMGSFQPLQRRYRHYTKTGVPLAWDEYRMQVWAGNTRTGERKILGGEQASSWAPEWSPDGRRLAFFSDQGGTAGLWIWEKFSGETKQVSDAIVRPWYETPLWTSDNKRIVTKLLPEGMSLVEAANLLPTADMPRVPLGDGTKPAVRVFTSPVVEDEAIRTTDGAWTNTFLSDLAVINVKTGKVQRIARNVKPRWVSLSPDTSFVAFMVPNGAQTNALHVYSFVENRLWVPASQIKSAGGVNVSWSPDSKFLSYLAEGENSKIECFVVSAQDGTVRKLAVDTEVSFTAGFRVPVWEATGNTILLIAGGTLWKINVSSGQGSEVAKISGQTIVEIVATPGRAWSPDNGRSVVVLAQQSGAGPRNGFYKIELATGQLTTLLEDETRRIGGMFTFDVSADGQWFVYGQQDMQHPEDLWVTDTSFAAPHQATNVAPIFEEYELGTIRVIEWLDANGRNLRGSLLLPAGYRQGKRYPLVVHVYEGERGSSAANQFGLVSSHPSLNMHVLATRGYAIFFPDAPLAVGRTLGDAANTVVPGINKVIELGFADSGRMAVMGFSQGSYFTLALLVQTTRFKAAIIGAVTHSDLMSGYLYMDDNGNDSTFNYEQGQGEMGKTPWEDRNRYIENSPVFYFDRVQTPLLICHGTIDAIPLSYPDATFVALRRLGKTVEYAVYAGEGHGISGYSNMVDWWNRQIRWLEKYLNVANTPQVPTMDHKEPQ